VKRPPVVNGHDDFMNKKTKKKSFVKAIQRKMGAEANKIQQEYDQVLTDSYHQAIERGEGCRATYFQIDDGMELKKGVQKNISKGATLNCIFGNYRMANEDLEEATISEEEESKKEHTIAFYENKAIRMRKLQQLIRQFENGTQFETEYKKKAVRVLTYLTRTRNLASKDLLQLVFECPKVLEISSEDLGTRYSAIEDCLMFEHGKADNFVQEFPNTLLMIRVEIQQRLILLEKLPIQPQLSHEKCVYLVRKQPSLLISKITNQNLFDKRVRNLLKLGFNAQQVYGIVIKHPSILLSNPATVSDKVLYILDDLNGSHKLFVNFPRALSTSLQRLKERHAYLLKESKLRIETRLNENKLRAIVMLTDSDFVQRATGTSLKHYREFQATFRGQQSDSSQESGASSNVK